MWIWIHIWILWYEFFDRLFGTPGLYVFSWTHTYEFMIFHEFIHMNSWFSMNSYIWIHDIPWHVWIHDIPWIHEFIYELFWHEIFARTLNGTLNSWFFMISCQIWWISAPVHGRDHIGNSVWRILWRISWRISWFHCHGGFKKNSSLNSLVQCRRTVSKQGQAILLLQSHLSHYQLVCLAELQCRYMPPWSCHTLSSGFLCSTNFPVNLILILVQTWIPATHDWNVFPNSRALLPTFRTDCPDGSHFAQMGSRFAQYIIPNPYSLLSNHTPLLGICTYAKHPQPHPKHPFSFESAQNELPSGQNETPIGHCCNMFEKWIKRF